MNAIINPDSKSRYEILDGLRGVAAILVVAFHVFEIYTSGNRFIQIINHGYLAVDFFFMLSGYVIGYAYDDRWSRMSLGNFVKRRLIRLQPMVVFGALLGALLFYFQKSEIFPFVADTSVGMLLLITFLGMLLIPVPVSMDVRGWTETFPLNGPAWTLFFEYIANILYALILRKVSKRTLTVLVVLSGIGTLYYALFGGRGDFIGGWALTGEQLYVGFTRLLFPFLAGLWLSRFGKTIRVKNGFIWCALILVTILSLPRFGGENQLWINGLYEALCIMIVFPFVILIGAGSELKNQSERLARFLGGISYPLYITHYPVLYVYFAWVINNNIPASQGYPVGFALLVLCVVLAYMYQKFYDEPVRKFLTKKFLLKK